MKRMSDQQLLARVESLRGREHEVTLGILFLLREVERRKLYLSLGHGSMFDFAVRRLKYSESAAGRRIQAARCIARHPEVAAMLRRHEVNLSTVALVSRVLTDANKAGLLERIRGKSQRDVTALVAEMNPISRIRDQVKPICVRVPYVSAHSRSGSVHGSPALFASAATPTILATIGPGGGTASPPAPALAPAIASTPVALAPAASSFDATAPDASTPVASAPIASAPAETSHGAFTPAASAHDAAAHSRCGSGGITETRYKVQFCARPEVICKLEEARALLSSRFPRGATLEDVIEAALDTLLEQKSPARRVARRVERRRRERTTRPKAGLTQPKAGRTATQPKRVSEAPRSRHIPTAVREAVWLQDDGRCTFVGSDGRRCGSTHLVQVDHIEPFVLGGPSDAGNLRLLCGPHNRLEAERILGSSWPTRARS